MRHSSMSPISRAPRPTTRSGGAPSRPAAAFWSSAHSADASMEATCGHAAAPSAQGRQARARGGEITMRIARFESVREPAVPRSRRSARWPPSHGALADPDPCSAPPRPTGAAPRLRSRPPGPVHRFGGRAPLEIRSPSQGAVPPADQRRERGGRGSFGGAPCGSCCARLTVADGCGLHSASALPRSLKRTDSAPTWHRAHARR